MASHEGDKAVERLMGACEGALDAHRKRPKDYPYLTLNEEGAISDLRLRLTEFEDANQAVNPEQPTRTPDAAIERPARVSVCTCGAPLIPTFHWRSREWCCIECGRLYDFFGCSSEDTTDELWGRYEALLAEWTENAGGKLITSAAKHEGCSKCWGVGGEDHERHATEDEWAAHKEAEEWLKTRRAAA